VEIAEDQLNFLLFIHSMLPSCNRILRIADLVLQIFHFKSFGRSFRLKLLAIDAQAKEERALATALFILARLFPEQVQRSLPLHKPPEACDAIMDLMSNSPILYMDLESLVIVMLAVR